MTFGEKLRDLRISRGWSQGQLAKGLGVSQTTVSSWEINVNEPDFGTLERIANFFNVSPYLLLPFKSTENDEMQILAETIQSSPKRKLLFDRTKHFSEQDLDALLTVASVISGRND